MGEAKRRARLREEATGILSADDPMEEAWRRFAAAVLPHDAPPSQRSEMRKAFYGGAAMMFEAIGYGTDPDADVTENDMRRVDQIAMALARFAEEMMSAAPTRGSA